MSSKYKSLKTQMPGKLRAGEFDIMHNDLKATMIINKKQRDLKMKRMMYMSKKQTSMLKYINTKV